MSLFSSLRHPGTTRVNYRVTYYGRAGGGDVRERRWETRQPDFRVRPFLVSWVFQSLPYLTWCYGARPNLFFCSGRISEKRARFVCDDSHPLYTTRYMQCNISALPHLLVRVPSVDLEVLDVIARGGGGCCCRLAPYGGGTCCCRRQAGRRPSCHGRVRRCQHHRYPPPSTPLSALPLFSSRALPPLLSLSFSLVLYSGSWA